MLLLLWVWVWMLSYFHWICRGRAHFSLVYFIVMVIAVIILVLMSQAKPNQAKPSQASCHVDVLAGNNSNRQLEVCSHVLITTRPTMTPDTPVRRRWVCGRESESERLVQLAPHSLDTLIVQPRLQLSLSSWKLKPLFHPCFTLSPLNCNCCFSRIETSPCQSDY